MVNKVDILASPSEVEEVSNFVAANAQRLLGVDAARVLPISARAALEAKLAHSSHSHGGVCLTSGRRDSGVCLFQAVPCQSRTTRRSLHSSRLCPYFQLSVYERVRLGHRRVMYLLRSTF